MTKQPRWKLVAQLGDVNPIDYGGMYVYVDRTGVYPPEAERLDYLDSEATWETRRFILENLKLVQDGESTYLVPARFDGTSLWPHPASHYDEWFHKGLTDVAECIGSTVDELRQAFISPDPTMRVWAWQAVGDYHGWDNLRQLPPHV